MTRLNSVLTGALLAASAVAQRPMTWRPVTLKVPNQFVDVDPLACRWETADTVFRRGPAGRIDVACDSPVDTSMLRCDAAGYEPQDLKASALCASPVITLDAAATAAVTTSLAGEVDLRWFRWRDGPSPTTRARRRTTFADTFSVQVGAASFLRVSLGEFSPHTFLGADLTRQSPVAIDWAPGGELFIRHDRGVIVPDAIDVAGPKSVTPKIPDGWVSEPDLTAGVYSLRRVYAGGVRTAAVNAAIEVGRTTDAGLPLEQVGGMRLVLDACGAGARLALFRKGQTGTVPVASARDCSWTVAGLAPGVYMLAITPSAQCSPEQTIEVTIAAQQWTDLSVPSPGVVVCGRVTLLGEPLGNMALSFERDDGFSQSESVKTNPDGRYAIALGQAGAYEVSLKTPHSIETQTIDVPRGASRYDVKVKGGRLTLKFPNIRESEYVTFSIDAPTGRTSNHFQPITAIGDIPVFGYGTFGVGGYVTSGADKGMTFERYETFEISAEHPTVRLELRLGKSGQELEVVDSTGKPAPGLRVGRMTAEGPAVPSLPPNRDGRSPINTLDFNVPMGTPLQLQSGEGRTCHIVTTTAREQVVIAQPSTRIEVRFPKPGDDLHGLVSGIPGATCPVPLSYFSSQRMTVDGREVVSIALPSGTLTLDRDGRSYSIRVPGPGLAIK